MNKKTKKDTIKYSIIYFVSLQLLSFILSIIIFGLIIFISQFKHIETEESIWKSLYPNGLIVHFIEHWWMILFNVVFAGFLGFKKALDKNVLREIFAIVNDNIFKNSKKD